MEPRKFYDSTAESYEKRHNNVTTKYMRKKEEELIKKYAKGNILDIGCGTGYHLKLVKNAIGLDISHKMLKKAGGNVIQANAEALPFEDESFDTVICFFSVLNFADPGKTVSEIKRVLKKDGTAILSLSSVWDMHDDIFLRIFFPRQSCKRK